MGRILENKKIYKSLLEIGVGSTLDIASIYLLYNKEYIVFPLLTIFGGWLIGDGLIRIFLDYYKKIWKYV